MVASGECDVVLLDMSLPDMHGLEVLKQLKQTYPTLPVLVFSVHPEQQYAVRAIKVGAAGYLTKDCESEELIAAIRKVAQGRRYISLSIGEQLAIELTTDTSHPVHATLSDREYQILKMLGVGKTVKEIAYDLSLSVKTVSTYRTRMLSKMHMKTNAELIHYVIHHQLLD
jgi:DNA-binding NarL/FixJ family response regulator